jgi:hypothetical protein
MIFYSYLFLIAVESIVDHAEDAVRVFAPTPRAIVLKLFTAAIYKLANKLECFSMVCADVY